MGADLPAGHPNLRRQLKVAALISASNSAPLPRATRAQVRMASGSQSKSHRFGALVLATAEMMPFLSPVATR